jgi:hypothetical protein
LQILVNPNLIKVQKEWSIENVLCKSDIIKYQTFVRQVKRKKQAQYIASQYFGASASFEVNIDGGNLNSVINLFNFIEIYQFDFLSMLQWFAAFLTNTHLSQN